MKGIHKPRRKMLQRNDLAANMCLRRGSRRVKHLPVVGVTTHWVMGSTHWVTGSNRGKKGKRSTQTNLFDGEEGWDGWHSIPDRYLSHVGQEKVSGGYWDCLRVWTCRKKDVLTVRHVKRRGIVISKGNMFFICLFLDLQWLWNLARANHWTNITRPIKHASPIGECPPCLTGVWLRQLPLCRWWKEIKNNSHASFCTDTFAAFNILLSSSWTLYTGPVAHSSLNDDGPVCLRGAVINKTMKRRRPPSSSSDMTNVSYFVVISSETSSWRQGGARATRSWDVDLKRTLQEAPSLS